MSPADSSDSSDVEVQPEEDPLANSPAHLKGNTSTTAFNQHNNTSTESSTTKTSNNSTVSSSSSTSSSSSNTTKSQTTTPTVSQPSVLSPLVYQTPQGMMYATPSNGGVIFSLAPQGTDANTVHPPQFITIPLSVVAANGQGELDLSKRK